MSSFLSDSSRFERLVCPDIPASWRTAIRCASRSLVALPRRSLLERATGRVGSGDGDVSTDVGTRGADGASRDEDGGCRSKRTRSTIAEDGSTATLPLKSLLSTAAPLTSSNSSSPPFWREILTQQKNLYLSIYWCLARSYKAYYKACYFSNLAASSNFIFSLAI